MISVNHVYGLAADTKKELNDATGTVEIQLKRLAGGATKWKISLEKSGPLGLGIREETGKAVIGAIKDAGVVAAYNKANAATAVQVDDEIVSVNGVTKDIKDTLISATGTVVIELKGKR